MPDAQTALKLIALDEEDLAVISANAQDCCARRDQMTYQPARKRFALEGRRYDWTAAEQGRHERIGAILRFDRVMKASRIGFDGLAEDALLSLLAIGFEETEAPSGIVTLAFFGGAAVRLEVECIEAELRDIGPRVEAEACLGHDAPPTKAGP